MSLDLSRIKALCFDVDGTLSDTDDLYARKVALLFPRFLFKDPARAARRFIMWIEAPGNALLGLADTLGIVFFISFFVGRGWRKIPLRSFPRLSCFTAINLDRGNIKIKMKIMT